MSDPILLADLQSYLRTLPIDMYGYADIAHVLGAEWARWPRAISIALALSKDAMSGVAEGPTLAYYRAYETLNARLNETCEAIAGWLRGAGYGARAFPATVSANDLGALQGTLSVPVQHKTVATRAGLGWIGKNALLISRRFGPRVRLASIFTDMPLPAADPVMLSACGACQRCVDACPASAIRGTSWHVGTSREELVDAWACQKVAQQLLQQRVGAHNAVCGICIAVCPFAAATRDEKR